MSVVVGDNAQATNGVELGATQSAGIEINQTESNDIIIGNNIQKTNIEVGQEQGDSAYVGSTTPVLRGPKGDPFTYEDFTEEQLEALRGPQGEPGKIETSMTEIELSTDISNPTEILNYINKSGTYVAKNLGIIGNNGEPVTAFAKGQFFTVSNLQEYYKAFDIEIPDNQNIIDVDARIIDGTYQTYRITGGTKLEQIVWLNSENVNDYVNVNFNPADFIDTYYGMQFYNGKLAIYSATLTDIENGTNIYKPITPNNIDYAVQTKGNKYFVKKADFTTLEGKVETLETNVDTLGADLTTLKTEIETILESVVSIDE